MKIALSWGRRDAGAGVCSLLTQVSLCLPLSCPGESSGSALCHDCVSSQAGRASSPPRYEPCLAQLGCELSHSLLKKQQNNNNGRQWLGNHSVIWLVSASICSWGCSLWASIAAVHPLTLPLLLRLGLVLRG